MGAGRSAPDWSAAYRQHATNLRTWLIAFGIGGPIALMGKDSAWQTFVASDRARFATTLFLSGVAVQVLVEMFDKHTAWFGYARASGIRSKHFEWKRSVSDWWMRTDIWSFLADAVPFVLFGWAALIVIRILLPGPPTVDAGDIANCWF